ncbi:MAG: NPCBM/NEW2 domain-containing protein [Candidatus Aphodosoma sp.]
MKRLVLSLVITFVSLSAMAQTYLVNAHAPKDSRYCEVYKYNGTSSKKIRTSGSYSWYGGFTIGRHSVLINEAQGFATFDIGGKYEKFTFVMGPAAGGTASEGTGISTDPYIMTVKVDGKKVIDKVLHPYDIPRRYTLDVKGAREITFNMAQGVAMVAIAEAVLWKSGETPRELQNIIKPATKPAQLIKDIPCYFSNAYIDIVAPTYSEQGYGRAKENGPKSITIGNQSYTYALLAQLDMAIQGNMTSWAYFNLQKKYKTFTFKLGTVGTQSDGSGWVAVAADGKTIYEKKWNASDLAEQVTLDIDGCESLKIWTEDGGGWAQRIGFADMMVYPAGMEPALAADAEVGNYGAIISRQSTIDPKLKSLPDICPLMSNIAPYSRKASVDKQIYDGTSDYITFSMGGVRYSEGFILYKRPWFMDDSTDSDVNFDLGNEFDYISFTTGFLGKSWYMNKDVLKVYADDKLVLVDTLYGTMMNRHYVVPINKCRKLRFECRGYGSVTGSSAYGCSDLILYRGEPKANELFVHAKPDLPAEVDLIDLGKPYIHFASPFADSKESICLTGESLRKGWRLPSGEIVYKGFILQTSSHFSLDAGCLGVLSNDPDDPKNKDKDAMGSVIGAAAVGSTFIPLGAVGGSYIGATMTGAAAFMVIAAGGTAVESSCAAFNTYGEYNSVTFTVGCLNANPGLLEERKSLDEVKKDPAMYDPEKLLVGVNGEVIAELSVFAAMEPQTVTLPIKGCEQLMFFLANTKGTSAIYVFYDIKLSKENKAQYIPSDAKAVKPYITYPRFEKDARISFMENTKLQRAKSSGAKILDSYMTDVYNLYDKVCAFAREEAPYHFETYYLEGENGVVYKAVFLKSDDDNKSYSDGRFPTTVSQCEYDLKALSEMRSKVVDLSIDQASAALDLPSLVFGAVAYGRIYREHNKALKNCKALIDVLYNEKMERLAELRKLLQNALVVEGKESTDYVLYNPMFKGESVPAEVGTSPLKNFYK